MLKTLRQNTKIVLWAVVAGFVGMIVFAWGMDVTGIRSRKLMQTMGEINGRKISIQEFRNAIQQAYAQQREQTKTEPDQRKLVQDTWDSIVNQILISQEIRKRNLYATDAEIVHYLHTTPPTFLQDLETFQTDGQFDRNKYVQFLDDPASMRDRRGQQIILYAESYARAVLPAQKLQDEIMAAVKVSDAEVREKYREDHEKVKVRYVGLELNSIPDSLITVTDADIRAYYEAHSSEYQDTEKRRYSYVVLEKKPTPADSLAVHEEAMRLVKEAREGADFAELAKEYSDDSGSAPKGGDLDYFGRGRMVKSFEDAAFAMKVGDISDPVLSRFGWHIIQLTDRRTSEKGEEEVKARHILLKIEPSAGTLGELRQKAEWILDDARQEGLMKAAQKHNVELKDTGFFSKGTFIPGIGGQAGSLVDFAFHNDVGAIPRVYENSQGLYILQLSGQRKAGRIPFEEVQDRVRREVETEQRKEVARTRLQPVAQALASGQTFEQAAALDSLQIQEPEPFTRTGYVRGIGSRNEFIATAFRLQQPGDVSDIVTTNRGAYLIQLVEKIPMDEEQFAQEKETLRKQLLNRKRNELYVAWFNDLKERAKIVDNRYLFYEY